MLFFIEFVQTNKLWYSTIFFFSIDLSVKKAIKIFYFAMTFWNKVMLFVKKTELDYLTPLAALRIRGFKAKFPRRTSAD